jgi:tetratricopeptide (TPR) repeat protein
MRFSFLIHCILLLFAVNSSAAEYETHIEVSQEEVDAWNKFATSLLVAHNSLLQRASYRVETTSGSYGGEYAKDYHFVEEKYFDKTNGDLLSHIRWHDKTRNEIHTIELFVYDKDRNLVRDYAAAYLPHARNAPYQTLINIHSHNEELHAYRQFDANGELLFEKCIGNLYGGQVMILLEDYEIPEKPFDYTAEYLACFSGLPRSAGIYLDPLVEIASKTGSTDADYHTAIKALSAQLEKHPANAKLYLKRGHAYFMVHEFSKSVDDYSMVIKLNPNLDEAWFGRGLAYGRNQQFSQSIADLSEYIRRDSSSSRGYTKRGVRYIWMGKLDLAKKDLQKAIALNPTNAEAHDDLGVLYAQGKQYHVAAKHFRTSIKNDPSYHKAHHNLAMVLFLTGDHETALATVDRALALAPQSRNSVLLKSEILRKLGKTNDATRLAEQAKSMEEGNWSELMNLAQE